MRALIILVATTLLLSGCGSMARQQLSPGYGRLAPCAGPHCVSSQEKNPERRVAPLVYSVSPAAAQASLVELVQRMEGAQVLANRPGYVHASFTSRLLNFVDDVEFVWVPGNRIDLRSSSRSGLYDFEVNRRRIEEIRAAFDRTQP